MPVPRLALLEAWQYKDRHATPALVSTKEVCPSLNQTPGFISPGCVGDFTEQFTWMASRGVAQPGRAPSSGGGSRWFESSRPDHFT